MECVAASVHASSMHVCKEHPLSAHARGDISVSRCTHKCEHAHLDAQLQQREQKACTHVHKLQPQTQPPPRPTTLPLAAHRRKGLAVQDGELRCPRAVPSSQLQLSINLASGSGHSGPMGAERMLALTVSTSSPCACPALGYLVNRSVCFTVLGDALSAHEDPSPRGQDSRMPTRWCTTRVTSACSECTPFLLMWHAHNRHKLCAQGSLFSLSCLISAWCHGVCPVSWPLQASLACTQRQGTCDCHRLQTLGYGR